MRRFPARAKDVVLHSLDKYSFYRYCLPVLSADAGSRPHSTLATFHEVLLTHWFCFGTASSRPLGRGAP